MVKEIKGQLTAGKFNYAIVVSRFNEFITGRLLHGPIDSLQRHGSADEQITVIWVPGASEITTAAARLARTGNFAAVICLGAIIRGQTDHYEFIGQQVSRGIAQINYETGVPTIFGVLTCQTIEQAIERAGSKAGNAGEKAAISAMEMVNVIKQI